MERLPTVRARRVVFSVVGAAIVAVLLPMAQGVVITAGSVTSSNPQTCTANANPASESASTGLIKIKMTHTIGEDNNKEDQWIPTLSVVWTNWPGKNDPLFPWTEGPGDKDDSVTLGDTFGQTDTYNGFEQVQWNSNEFERAGTYDATATVSIVHKDRSWNSGQNFTERCAQSDDANIRIVWDPATEEGHVIIL